MLQTVIIDKRPGDFAAQPHDVDPLLLLGHTRRYTTAGLPDATVLPALEP